MPLDDFTTGQEPKLLDPREIYDFIIRRWKLIASAALLSCGLFVAISYTVTPAYRASARILFADPVDFIPVESPGSQLGDASAYVESQIAVLSSTSILQKVVDAEGLADDREFGAFAVEWLREALTVSRVGLSNVVEVSVTSTDAQSAMSLTNAIAETYVSDRIDSRYEGANEASNWLRERAELLRAELSRSEDAVEKFRTAHNLLVTSEGSLTEQQLSQMNVAVINARADLAAKRSKYQQAQKIAQQGGDLQTIPDVLQSDVVSALRAQHAVVTRRKADLLSKYGDRHPAIQTAEAERRDIETQIEAEIGRLIGNLRNEVEAAEAHQTALASALASVSSQSEVEGHIGVELRDLERIAAANKQLYETFLSRAKIAQERATLLNSGIRVITHASLPRAPSFPDKPLFGAVGLVFGLFVGGAAAFLQELFRSGFVARQQVEETLAVPVIASMPRMAAWPRSANAQPIAYLAQKPMSRFSEEVRRLRLLVNIVADPHAPPRILLVTSAVVGEGKTTLALSLAHSAAADGNRVLLIDADLRRSTATACFDLSREVGLVDLLTVPIELESAIHPVERSNIHLLPSGAATQNPPALLSSSRMRSTLEALRNQYDLLVIDAPPVGPVSDAAILATYADKVIFAVRWRHTAREAVAEGIRHLSDRSKIAGIVLTMVDEPKLPKYGRYASIGSSVSGDYYSN
ncbi:polysaccharide biosynthesis tyrosine autokinase [Nitratireductor sp. ZSWI3]|uniref:GumC family protein n=1 Tax=Nitratireductor sp. ZSWI3 TaxID=2966359 RepID=UPI0021500272|nr:polysaccharide biosynthesis tyrosine autokinase [Nitratireductor sp. ZSWI3]MCR4267834.1 polysaccharide biosynthesis tyrosine autokinase [Nitratireductor sp. ZSWI3]